MVQKLVKKAYFAIDILRIVGFLQSYICITTKFAYLDYPLIYYPIYYMDKSFINRIFRYILEIT